jgi:hypothetical protein
VKEGFLLSQYVTVTAPIEDAFRTTEFFGFWTEFVGWETGSVESKIWFVGSEI